MKKLFWLVFFAIFAVVASGSVGMARAATAPEVLERARREDAALALAKALASYDEVRKLDPNGARGAEALLRAQAIRARSEGDFEPLAALERVRRDPQLSSDGAAIDALVREAEAFPPGLVRVEVWVLAAEAYARRLHREDVALPLWERIASDPAADASTVQIALRSLALARLERKEWSEAQAVAARRGADPKLVDDVRRGVRRHDVHFTSVAFVAATLVLAAMGVARSRHRSEVSKRTRGSARLIIGYAVYVALAGAMLATGYEGGHLKPFLCFGLVLLPLLLVARAWGAAGSNATAARTARALVCGSGVLGAAFLVLEGIDATYLEGFGL